MSEFEPLNIAHYQQPTTPLSDGAAPYMDWIEVKRLVTCPLLSLSSPGVVGPTESSLIKHVSPTPANLERFRKRER
jgi:hypothetical protein